MAATILVVAFVGMIQAMLIGSQMMDHARRQTLATQILNQEVESLRGASWASISALPTTATTVTIDSQFTSAIAASGATYSLTRQRTSPNPDTNLCEVNFTVTWTVRTSRRNAANNLLTFSYTRKTSAYYGKYGLNLTFQRS